MPHFALNDRKVGDDAPTFFIADISANHDGSLERAISLIHLAASSGASAAKFQNFRAPKIVSEYGFASLGSQISHQAKWRKSVSQVYAEASLPWEWTPQLKSECDRAGIVFMSTPYDLEAVDMLDPFVPAFKIGSGDITWPEMIAAVASKHKPAMLAAGASDLEEVRAAVELLREQVRDIVLMQCNTNYTGSLENFKHIHLNVLKTFRREFPDAVLGLSDHTPGHATVLGAVALGARVIEKHFTDDCTREGPDHPFSMTPVTWRDMVDRTRELEYSLGDETKTVCENERETVIVQRRCVRARTELPAGVTLTREMLEVLRPAPDGSISPWRLGAVVGRTLRTEAVAGQAITADMLS